MPSLETIEGSAAAIREIERLADEAHKTSILDAPKGERPGTYYLVGPDGKATRTVADPPWGDFKLDTPAQLRQFVQDHTGGGEDADAVFYTEERVVFVFNEKDRRDKGTCDLNRSAPFQWLQTASNNPVILNQPEFVRLLRIAFRGCLPDRNLLTLVRQLKFTATTEGAGVIQHGRESMSKSLLAEVAGEAAIPEEVALLVPVFENHPHVSQVVCALEVLPQQQSFRMTPYPMEVRRAMDDALDSIRELFQSETMPAVYKGRPS